VPALLRAYGSVICLGGTVNFNGFVYSFVSIILCSIFYFSFYQLENEEVVSNIKLETKNYHPHSACIERKDCITLFIDVDALGHIYHEKEIVTLDKLSDSLIYKAVTYNKSALVLSAHENIALQRILDISDVLTSRVKPQSIRWRTLESDI
jgi:biopolymer transport protein ExbD